MDDNDVEMTLREVFDEKTHRTLFHLAWALLYDAQDSEEVVQETMVAAWRLLRNRCSPPDNWEAWLKVVAKRKAISALKVQRRQGKSGDSRLGLGACSIVAHEAAEQRMYLRALILNAFDSRMSRIQLATVLLHEEGYRDHEIAQMLGLKAGSVAKTRERTIAKLRRIAESTGLSPVTSRSAPVTGRASRLNPSHRTPPRKE